MNEKKVSIILPVYNGAEHVLDSIESIVNQTYDNWELIIVNDCSTDNTLEICQCIANNDSRIKVISNECNLKLPNTLNAGFREATGNYYTWTSDDNMYKPNAICKLVETLEKNPDAVMVYADYTNIDVDGNILGEGKLQEPEKIVVGNVCGACFLYTADVAKRVGEYDANLFLAEDYDYWMRIYRYGRVIHITDNLYLYRRHAGSLTETKKASIKEQTYRAIEKNFMSLYTDAKKHGLNHEFFDHIMVRAESHKDETLQMLLSIDCSYEKYLSHKLRKNNIQKNISDSLVYKIYRKMKGIRIR
ncbi:Glycosyl transferase family 2 [Pseudobutyrivibrio sp. UC1225]|uniref:glycosyltransferase family 2 protein n=1 Tax=Pseudobutyrivibrio sp. UC1225 TaxID=1798185 RepID=UPI0008E4595C|nr:glycosyltransferase [Pseudobutyrivibrio sp. UC1225]SFN78992.1 Glycosyl transferase family 2 [Pseudobutyrivibrio sp. UC1225]